MYLFCYVSISPYRHYVVTWLVRKLIQKRLRIHIQHSQRGTFSEQLSLTYSPKCTIWHIVCHPPNVEHILAPMYTTFTNLSPTLQWMPSLPGSA